LLHVSQLSCTDVCEKRGFSCFDTLNISTSLVKKYKRYVKGMKTRPRSIEMVKIKGEQDIEISESSYTRKRYISWRIRCWILIPVTSVFVLYCNVCKSNLLSAS